MNKLLKWISMTLIAIVLEACFLWALAFLGGISLSDIPSLIWFILIISSGIIALLFS